MGFLISLWAGSSAISAFVDSVVEAHDQTPLRHPVRQRLFALVPVRGDAGVRRSSAAPLMVRGPRKVAELIPDGLAGCAAYGYYPALITRPDGRGHHPVPGGAARTAAVASADLRRGAGQRGIRDRDAGPAHLPEVDHQHRLHLRRAGHTDRVSAVRLLRRLRHHAGRGVQRRDPGGMAGAAHPCPPAAAVAGLPQPRKRDRRRPATDTDDDTRRRAAPSQISSS